MLYEVITARHFDEAERGKAVDRQSRMVAGQCPIEFLEHGGAVFVSYNFV